MQLFEKKTSISALFHLFLIDYLFLLIALFFVYLWHRVIDQLWPSIGHFITLTLAGKLEPLIQKSLEEFSLKDFKFDHVLLGNIPPRIGGIKCYEKTYTSRDEIILDFEVTLVNLIIESTLESFAS